VGSGRPGSLVGGSRRARVIRGEVWTVAGPAAFRWRVAVLSADAYAASGEVYCAPIVRRPAGEQLPPYAVPLGEPDPVSGMVLVGLVERIPVGSGAERVGMVTGATMARIAEALRDLFEL
jgi:mRNA interferase MazF